MQVWFETTVRGGFPVEAYVDTREEEFALYPSAKNSRRGRLGKRLTFLENALSQSDIDRLYDDAAEALAE